LIPAADAVDSSDGQREAALMEMLIAMRAQARADRDYARSDAIRDQLAALGISLEDRADGTIWKLN
jgi:cysteinyl-tRNA synthetase